MISLGAGKPSSAYFPFDEVNVKISDAAGSKSMMSMAAYDFQPGVNDYGKLTSCINIHLAVWLLFQGAYVDSLRLGRCSQL